MIIITISRKPLDGTCVENVLKHGIAGLDIDGGRISLRGEKSTSEARRKSTFGGIVGERACESESKGKINRRGDPAVYAEDHGGEKGRWPSNVILESSVVTKELDNQSGISFSSEGRAYQNTNQMYSGGWAIVAGLKIDPGYGDEGGASRFFKIVS